MRHSDPFFHTDYVRKTQEDAHIVKKGEEKVVSVDDVVILDNAVIRSQVFKNAYNRRSMLIEFEKPIEFDEDALAQALGLPNCQVFLAKKNVFVLWEVSL